MKKYELSLSRNYVSKWGIIEAIREIVQNCIDSNTDGHDFFYDYDNNTLKLGNKNISIDASKLVLGNTTKANDKKSIGIHGEGFKLALLILVRNNIKVTVYNGNKIWIPSIEYSDNFLTEVLCINEYESSHDDKNLVFEIQDMEDYLDDINEMVLIFNKYNYVDSKYGEILLDKEQKGKMYVNGLYVMYDSEFDYGYNFKAEYVDLDRDRKYIAWSDLKEIASKSIITANLETLMNAVNGKGIDTDRIESHIDEISDEVKKQYKEMYYKKYNLKEDVKLITESQANANKIIDNENYHITKSLNIKLMSSNNYIDELKEFDSKQTAYNYYNGSAYKELIEWFSDIQDCISSDKKEYFLDIVENFETNYFDKIKEEIFGKINIF